MFSIYTLLSTHVFAATADDEKRANEEVQQLTDVEIKRIEDLFKAKEKEIMTV